MGNIEENVNSLFVEMGMWAPFYENYKCQQARLVKLDYKTICNYRNVIYYDRFFKPLHVSFFSHNKIISAQINI